MFTSVVEKFELDLLRERISSESVIVIGREHPADEERETMRHVDPRHPSRQIAVKVIEAGLLVTRLRRRSPDENGRDGDHWGPGEAPPH